MDIDDHDKTAPAGTPPLSEQHSTPHRAAGSASGKPADDAAGPASADVAAGAGADAESEESVESGEGRDAGAAKPLSDQAKPISLLRQLLRNLYGGLRISLLLRVQPDQFCATPGALALLAVIDFLFNLGACFLLVGRSGYFSYSAVPSFFFHIPLLLFFAFIVARILSRPSLAMVIPVALIALSIPIELCHSAMERISLLHQMGWLQDYLYAAHYYRFFWWWSVAALLFLLRLEPAPRRFKVLLLFLVLLVLPLWFFPRADLWVSASEAGESGELRLTEEVLTAQAHLLDGELAGLLPGRKGVTDLYFVGFAGDATQDVFLKELRAAERLFSKRFGATGRTVVLANNPQTAATLPFASASNLERALARVGQVMNRDEDVLFLFLTSHGSKEHELAVNNAPLELDALTPERVRSMLKKSGIKWKVVVVSACFAGGYIEPLQDEGSLVITAADATHESFGCGYGENFTWFGEAFIDDALRHTFSFTEAFEKARGTIRRWEEEQGETPSNPQIWIGKEIGEKLKALEKQLAQREERLSPSSP